MTFGEICRHQQLKRKCDMCELEEQYEKLQKSHAEFLEISKKIIKYAPGGCWFDENMDSEYKGSLKFELLEILKKAEGIHESR